MIALDNVTILKPGFARRDPILEDATATFRLGERTGILAAPGTGKSTIARMLCGIEQPDFGTVHAGCPVSWPIGFAGFLHPSLSVRDNLAIFSRMLGISSVAVEEFCIEFCGIENLRNKRMSELTPTQRAMLAYACALANPEPSMWIADEVITIGEPRDRAKCDEVLSQRLANGGLIFLSRNLRVLKAYCDRFFVLINKRLMPCEDPDVAQEMLEMAAQERGTATNEVLT